MSMLRKEWTTDEIEKLGQDLKTAKINVLIKHGFTVEEIARIAEIPESVILRILSE